LLIERLGVHVAPEYARSYVYRLVCDSNIFCGTLFSIVYVTISNCETTHQNHCPTPLKYWAPAKFKSVKKAKTVKKNMTYFAAALITFRHALAISCSIPCDVGSITTDWFVTLTFFAGHFFRLFISQFLTVRLHIKTTVPRRLNTGLLQN